MIRRRLTNIIMKEWETTFSNTNSALFITLLPLLITGQALLYIYLIIRFAGGDALAKTILWTAVERLQDALPSLTDLSMVERFQILFFNQFPVYLLLIPTMTAISIATFSIIEEKQNRSLEPLLATPVRTSELLLGKSLAGAIPALIITWICAGLFLVGIVWLGSFHLLKIVLGPSWFISLFLVVPSMTVLSFLLGVIASSRASDPRGAQNIGIVIILPVLAIIGLQLIGRTLFTPFMLLIMAIGIALLSLLILRVAIHLFRRESIIVKWQ